MTLKNLIVPSLLVLGLAACGGDKTESTPADKSELTQTLPASDTAILGDFGIALENMDTSVKPGENFFEYVNGTWLKNTEIPSDRSAYSSFSILGDQSEARVRKIIEDAAASANPSADEKRLGDFYNAFLNTDAIEEAGLSPLKKDMDAIQSAKTHKDIVKLMADPRMGLASPVNFNVYIDAKENENYIVYIGQSGLSLPNKNYYFDDSEKGQVLRGGFVDYLAALFTQAGADDAQSRAEAVMAFETALAKGHWEPVKRRNRDLTYNKMGRAELNEIAPGMMWDTMFDALGLGDQKTVIVREKSAIEDAAKVLAAADVETLKDYMLASLISGHAPYLPKTVDDARFNFYGKTLRGQEEQRPRWKRAVSQINGTLGEVVGKVYVEKHFPPSSKSQMQELVENLRASFKDGIDNLEWMDDKTKEQAQYKLAKFNPKIGYPDKWETYAGLNIDKDDLIGTVQSARAWEWKDSVDQLGKPIDRDVWGMTPQRVNAYYNSVLNEIVFPAAILDAPFFDPNADPAVNYGGIGAVIGHEMGHGFDDQGRKSDGDGVQRDWWSEEDAKKYMVRADRLAEQYNEFEPLPGEFLDGRLGLGENIGDLTGVTMAYDAYKRSLGGKDAPVIDGFTGDQRFFMAWAQVWAVKWKDAALSTQIKNGPHSPGEYRANGILRNFDAWYDAFDVQPGDAMYLPPEQRVKIW